MWLPRDIVAEVERVARVFYVNVADTKLWNDHRRPGELRMLTGWGWSARNGSASRQGFKTITVAYVDAHYALVQRSEAPVMQRRRLSMVADTGSARRRKSA